MSRLQVHHENMELLRKYGITEEMLLAIPDDTAVAQLVELVESGGSGEEVLDFYRAIFITTAIKSSCPSEGRLEHIASKKEVNTMDRSEKVARKAGKVARTGTDTAKAAGNWIATDGKAHAKTAGKATNRFLKKAVRKSIAISKAAKDAYHEGNVSNE